MFHRKMMTKMKAKLFIIISVLFVSTITLFGQERNLMRSVNIDSISNTKEYIVYNKRNSKPLYKSTYQYNENDANINRTAYLWSDSKGWIESHKHDYIYNADNKLAYVIYTKWDRNNNKWADIAELYINIYDKNNKFVATQKAKLNNKDNKFLVLK